jgi:hypothetical protein
MNLNKCPRPAFRVLIWFAIILATVSNATASWKEKVLYSFQGVPDGSLPIGGVVFDQQGNLYGATQDGGSASCRSANECGTVFQLAPPAKQGDPWTETVLYIFKGNASNDGTTPFGGLVIDSLGNLYGTTGYGGTGGCILLGSKLGCGIVFELSPPAQKGGAWTETILYSFKGGKDGYLPNGDLVFDSAGNLYGATQFGGGKGTTCNPFYQYCGTVFELSPPKTKGGKWTEKVLHGFKSGTDGANPNGGLVLDIKGAIYGTTDFGGNRGCKTDSGIGCGTAFELQPPKKQGGGWIEKMLHVFSGGNDGASPLAGLTFGKDSALYGTAAGGSQFGVAFRLAPKRSGQWGERVLHTFTDNAHGRGPASPLTFDAAGNLYGGALGGANFRGVLFRLRRGSSGSWTFSDLYSFAGPPDGSYPSARLIYDGGILYSTTQGGGTGTSCSGYCGTVFQVSP